jgi:hypothetical protein
MTWRDVGLAALDCHLRISTNATQLGGDLAHGGRICRLLLKDTIQPNPLYVSITFRGSAIFGQASPRRIVFLADSDLQGDEAVMVHRWLVEGAVNSGCSLLFIMRQKNRLGEELVTPVLGNPFRVHDHPGRRPIQISEVDRYLDIPGVQVPLSWFE